MDSDGCFVAADSMFYALVLVVHLGDVLSGVHENLYIF